MPRKPITIPRPDWVTEQMLELLLRVDQDIDTVGMVVHKLSNQIMSIRYDSATRVEYGMQILDAMVYMTALAEALSDGVEEARKVSIKMNRDFNMMAAVEPQLNKIPHEEYTNNLMKSELKRIYTNIKRDIDKHRSEMGLDK
jgi:hypothetical protein